MIKKGEFTLLCQAIRPLSENSGSPGHYEVFVRLLEEERKLMPPGAFFPVAEEFGLIPQLDRWVVEHILAWIATRSADTVGAKGETFFINISQNTIGDLDFPDFVETHLRKSGVPDDALCFEIPEAALNSGSADAEKFVQLVKQCGYRVALTGFGRERVSVQLLKDLPLDFLKIDGSVILGMLRNSVDLGKVIAINRVSKVIGVHTIAEMVETPEAVTKLREINVEFAQGFGIAKPRPLADLDRC